MQHREHTHRVLRVLTCAAFIVAGISLLALTAAQRLSAQVLVTEQQGSTLLDVTNVPSGEAMLLQAPLHGAALIESQPSAGWQLLLGALLILLGFGLHALLVSHGDRSVPVHAAARKGRGKGVQIKSIEYLWIRRFRP